jgi:hypothetical protein
MMIAISTIIFFSIDPLHRSTVPEFRRAGLPVQLFLF